MASGGSSGVPVTGEEAAAAGPGGCGVEAEEEEEQEVLALAGHLRRRLRGWEASLAAVQRLLVWERPPQSLAGAVALGVALWLFSSTSLRPLFLLSVALIGFLLLERWKPRFLLDFSVHYLSACQLRIFGQERSIKLVCPVVCSWLKDGLCFSPTAQPLEEPGGDSYSEMAGAQPHLLSVPELCHCLAESWITFRLYLQELLQYKRQNPAKFCARVCSGCLSLAVVGHYVPGIMISYIVLLSILLWPLVVYHELIQRMYTRLEPILMKLDYSMKVETLHLKHEKKKRQGKNEPEAGSEPMAETESESEAELSGYSPVVRATAGTHDELELQSHELCLPPDDPEMKGLFAGPGVFCLCNGELCGSSKLLFRSGFKLECFSLAFFATTPRELGRIFSLCLPCMQVDVKKTALALAITDSELSDEEASILESGGFTVSRATTPQLTDVSEGAFFLTAKNVNVS
uniref:Uncharacterized protein n=1 Tax=Sphaerodactylus townsendi TaxID=933632 RepID=A0ACB8G243_9SAUR